MILFLLIFFLKCEVEKIINVFRHGSRNSSKILPIKGTDAPEQLTIIGMKQQYLLGKSIFK